MILLINNIFSRLIASVDSCSIFFLSSFLFFFVLGLLTCSFIWFIKLSVYMWSVCEYAWVCAGVRWYVRVCAGICGGKCRFAWARVGLCRFLQVCACVGRCVCMRECVGVHWCALVCTGVREFSEFLPENRVLTSADLNCTYPIRIFLFVVARCEPKVLMLYASNISLQNCSRPNFLAA